MPLELVAIRRWWLDRPFGAVFFSCTTVAADQSGDLQELVSDPRTVERALRRAVRRALVRHKQLGLPIVVARDGRPMWIDAVDIHRPTRDEVASSLED